MPDVTGPNYGMPEKGAVIDIPTFHYTHHEPKPYAEVSVATGYEYDAERLTAVQCRDLAEWLLTTADELDAIEAAHADRMTNYSMHRHRTPFEPYELKRAKGTNTWRDDFHDMMRRQLSRQSWFEIGACAWERGS